MAVGLGLALAFALAGCELIEPAAIAKVDGARVPAKVVVDEADKRGLARTERVVARLVEEQIDLHVAEALIEELKLDEDPEFRRKVRMLALSTIEARLAKEAPSTEVSDAEVAAAYEASPERFVVPEKVRVALVARPASRKGAEGVTAAQCRRQLLAEDDPDQRARLFARLASLHSTHRASRYRGGDVGYVTRGANQGWPPSLVAAAFALRDRGEVSPVIETPDAQYVLRLLERQPARRESLEVAARALRPELMAQKQRATRAWVREQLRAQVSLERYDSAVRDLVDEDASELATRTPGGPSLSP